MEGGVGAVISISSSSGSDFVDFCFLSFLGSLLGSSCCSRFRFLGFSAEGVETLALGLDGEWSDVFSFLSFLSFFSFFVVFSFDFSFFGLVGFTSSMVESENFLR